MICWRWGQGGRGVCNRLSSTELGVRLGVGFGEEGGVNICR